MSLKMTVCPKRKKGRGGLQKKFTKEVVQMANKCTKMCPTPLVIRQI